MERIYNLNWKNASIVGERRSLEQKVSYKLYKKISCIMKVFEQVMTYNNNSIQNGLLLYELFFMVSKAKSLIKSYRDENWNQLAIFQFKNKESFRKILWNLKCCYDVTSKELRMQNWKTIEETTLITFDDSIFNEVEGDNEDLYMKLVFASGDENDEYCKLAKNLLQRLEDIQCIEGGELDGIKLFSNPKNIEIMECIGEGGFGKVYKAKWWGLLCTVKEMQVGYKKYFVIEGSILASLSHLNLIKYYFAMKNDDSGDGQFDPTKKNKKKFIFGNRVDAHKFRKIVRRKSKKIISFSYRYYISNYKRNVLLA